LSETSKSQKKTVASFSGKSSGFIVTPEDKALYSHLVEGLSEYAVFALSPAGLILSWNAGAENTFGYTAEEVLGIFSLPRIGLPAHLKMNWKQR
jgi:PAS domain-containing protein